MSRTLPCPGCGAGVFAGYLLASGFGIVLDPERREGATAFNVYALHDHGLATPTRGAGYGAHACDGGSFDVVVTVLRGQATVRASDARVERVAKRALGGRMAGPVGALTVVLGRLEGAGLSVHHIPTTSGG